MGYTSEMDFNRVISEEFEKLLSINGYLNWLVNMNDTYQNVPLDLQIRRGNKIAVYAGLTRFIEFIYKGENTISVTAHPFYKNQTKTSSFYTQYKAKELIYIQGKWNEFINNIMIGKRHLHKEGFTQARMSHRYGRFYHKGDLFCVIDREAVIDFSKNGISEKNMFLNPIKDFYKKLGCTLYDRAKRELKHPINEKAKKSPGDELDILAITAEGDLAVIEVKHGSDASGIYCSPIQVAAYKEMWDTFPKDKLKKRIYELVEQRKRVGLLPKLVNSNLKDDFKVIPIIVIGEPNERSTCWDTMEWFNKSINKERRNILKDIVVMRMIETGEIEIHRRLKYKNRSQLS